MTKKQLSHPFLRPSRREFIRCVVVTAGAAGSGLSLIACGDDEPKPLTSKDVFPQGVASGDPRPDSVILWTRVESASGGDEAVLYEVATDDAFTSIVSSGELTASAAADHTIRLKLTGLSSFTTYYYRFSARDLPSVTGRTKTAPEADADVDVRFAMASCQDFNGRYYHAWKALADEETPVDFVVFLGDYIYETNNDPRFQSGTKDRMIEVPKGLALNEEGTLRAALHLDDYRSIYKQVRSDEHLQRAHALFPFITIWDDHEFADDSWQDHATHFNGLYAADGDEKDTNRRTNASQAWYEYQPVDLDRDATANFPNDLQIYRSFRFGKHVDLFLTDERSYRDDHVIPEGPANLTVAKFDENSALGSRNFVLKDGFDPLEAEAPPTMLGDTQRNWLLDGISNGTATWKFWGGEVQRSQMLVDLSGIEAMPETFRNNFYFSVDQWDGYRTERAAILSALGETPNVVCLAGDIHAFYASELHPDFDNPGDEPVAVEFVTAGISSMSVQEMAQTKVEDSQLFTSLGLGEIVPKFDELLRGACPYYQYSKSKSYGVTIIDVSATEVIATMLQISDVSTEEYKGTVERVQLRVEAGTKRIVPVA